MCSAFTHVRRFRILLSASRRVLQNKPDRQVTVTSAANLYHVCLGYVRYLANLWTNCQTSKNLLTSTWAYKPLGDVNDASNSNSSNCTVFKTADAGPTLITTSTITSTPSTENGQHPKVSWCFSRFRLSERVYFLCSCRTRRTCKLSLEPHWKNLKCAGSV